MVQIERIQFLTVVFLLRKWKRRLRPSFSYLLVHGSGAAVNLLGVAVAHRQAAGGTRAPRCLPLWFSLLFFFVLAETAALEPGLEVALGGAVPGGAQGGHAMMQVGQGAATLPARKCEPGRKQGRMEAGNLAPLGRVNCERKGSIGRLRVCVHGRVLLV
jgi:hypothetical protein